jgi:hypothetical protein
MAGTVASKIDADFDAAGIGRRQNGEKKNCSEQKRHEESCHMDWTAQGSFLFNLFSFFLWFHA